MRGPRLDLFGYFRRNAIPKSQVSNLSTAKRATQGPEGNLPIDVRNAVTNPEQLC